jgi:hypothetical protein
MKKLPIAALIVFAAIGCKSQQLPPTVHIITLTVTSQVPSGSTWVASKESLAAGAVCDPPTSTNYKQINSVPQSSSTFVDNTSAGSTVCEFLQYIDAGGATSPASNVVGPYTVPANPTAPVIGGQTAATKEAEAIPSPTPTLAKDKSEPVTIAILAK